MISILIPTYNHTCYKLVSDLQHQAETIDINYEIIVAEDGSRDQVSIIANHKIGELPNCHHIVNKNNTGRAAIRNLLANKAKGEWLLFIDSDAMVENCNFIRNYADNLKEASVIVGGLYHKSENSDPERSLRFSYEKKADLQRSATIRQKNPHSQLSTFNLLISRKAFNAVGGFNEKCNKYGYEDALMGWELERLGIEILHIDNPLLHTGLDRNKEFVEKSEQAIKTLITFDDETFRKSRIGQAYHRLARWKLTGVSALIYTVAGRIIKRNLLSDNPSLTLFAAYKFLYLCKIKK